MSETSAVVIGASGGIGAALVEALETAGGHAVVHPLSRSGTGLDLEEEASIAAAAQGVADGPPPALVLVATGVLHGDHAPERTYRALSAEHLLRDYRLNAVGPALVAKHFLPLMPRTGRSVFGALSARVGSIGDNRLGGWYSYRASKAALNQLLHTASIELQRLNPAATVLALHPGTTDTALSRPFQSNVPPGKLFEPAFAAQCVIDQVGRTGPADSGSFWGWDGQRIPW